MVLRLRIGGDARGVPPGAGEPRRPFIYPHRSVRFVGQRRVRLIVALGASIVLTAMIAAFMPALLGVHARVARAVMSAAAIPHGAWRPVEVYPLLGTVPAPGTPVPAFREVSDVPRLLLVAIVAALMVASQRWPLMRSLAGFLMALLIVSAIVNSIYPDLHLDAGAFTSIWFRIESIVWLVMPWITSVLFIVFQPHILTGAALVLLAQAYGFLFGVLRYVFFLGVMHYSGLLFFPALWLVLGLLADLLYLLLLYSLAVHRVGGTMWGRRESWQ